MTLYKNIKVVCTLYINFESTSEGLAKSINFP